MLVVAHPHGGENRREEELDPQLIHAAFSQLGISFQQQSKCLAVGKLVVAPFTEPFENRVEPHFRMLFQVALNRDVAGITDLFRQISRVIDELRAEIRVFLCLCQKA